MIVSDVSPHYAIAGRAAGVVLLSQWLTDSNITLTVNSIKSQKHPEFYLALFRQDSHMKVEERGRACASVKIEGIWDAQWMWSETTSIPNFLVKPQIQCFKEDIKWESDKRSGPDKQHFQVQFMRLWEVNGSKLHDRDDENFECIDMAA